MDLEQFKAVLGKRSTPARFKVDRFVEDVPAMLRECYADEVARRKKIFTGDKEAEAHIQKAAYWLVNQQTKTSLLLLGSVGNGKTTLATAICRLISILYGSPYKSEQKHVTAVKAIQIPDIVKQDPERWERITKSEMLFVDDFGTENVTVKSWGNEISPVTEMLYYRYDHQLFTILTSNLTIEDLGARYGERIADRMAEMFDRIPFSNPSYRQR